MTATAFRETAQMLEALKLKGIARTDLANLSDFRWIDNRENLLLFGPPGVGKTHRVLPRLVRESEEAVP